MVSSGITIADQLDAGKAAHRWRLNQGLFHGWIAERIPLLQQVDTQHHCQWVRRPTTLFARLGVVRFDQGDQRRPRNNDLHLSEEFLTFGLLLVATPRSTFGRGKRGGELVIREAELLAAHHLSPGI